MTWHKSTKSFGSSENFFNILWNNALEDKMNIFNSSNFKDFQKELCPKLIQEHVSMDVAIAMTVKLMGIENQVTNIMKSILI